MRYSKTPKPGEYSTIAQIVTINDLVAMTEFIRNFKLKYAPKKSNPTRKRNKQY